MPVEQPHAVEAGPVRRLRAVSPQHGLDQLQLRPRRCRNRRRPTSAVRFIDDVGQEPHLEQALGILARGFAVGDDARADAHFANAAAIVGALEHGRADGDVEQRVPVGREPTNRAAVDAAWAILQLGDQLHRADFRRARYRSRREDASHQLIERDAVDQAGLNARGHLVQRLERLDREQVRDFDAADIGNTAEVVAHQVDDHQVFRALLGVGGQHALGLLVGRRIRAARAGALHRPGRNRLAVALDEQFWRSGQDRMVAGFDDAAVGDALLLAQLAVKRDRWPLQAKPRPERQVHLVDIAGMDVGHGALEALAIGRFVPRVGDIAQAGGGTRCLLAEPHVHVAARHQAGRAEQAEPDQRYVPSLWQ